MLKTSAGAEPPTPLTLPLKGRIARQNSDTSTGICRLACALSGMRCHSDHHDIDAVSAGRADSFLEPIGRRLQAMAASRFEAPVATGDIVEAAARLGSKRLIMADKALQRLRMRVSLNVPSDDVVHVLRSEASGMPWMHSISL